jgi:TPR repeat protein
MRTSTLLFATLCLILLFAHTSPAFAQQESSLSDLHRKAEQGDAEAQFTLGRYYEDRHRRPKSYTIGPKAREWYQKAAEQGHAEAQYRVGKDMLFDFFSDAPRAAEWYRKAAEQGHARAQLALGWMYKTGRGVPKDEHKAVELFYQAAEQDEEVKNALEDLQQDMRMIWLKVLAWFALCAVALMVVMEGYAWLLRRAACLPRPLMKLSEFVLGLVCACMALLLPLFGLALLGPVVSSVFDTILFVWLAACLPCALPAALLFRCRHEAALKSLGYFQPAAKDGTVEWCQKEAEQGNAEAQFELGWRYEHGRGVPKDVRKAVEWYRKAAAQGNKSAQNALDRLK